MSIDFGVLRETYTEQGAHVYTHLGIHEAVPFAFDPNETIKHATAEQNIAALSAADPEIAPYLAVISSHPELMTAFGELCADEGSNIERLSTLFQGSGDQALTAEQFAEMMESDSQRGLLTQAMRSAGTDEHSMDQFVDFAESAVAMGREGGQTPENTERFRQRARALGVNTGALETQQMMEGFRDFMRDPAGTLAELGIPADIIAMLEPFLRFFTGSADYYMNGAPGQRGLNQIGADMADGVRTRTAEIQRDHPQAGAPVFFTSAGAQQVDADGAPAVRSQFDHARTGTVIEPGADRQSDLARSVVPGYAAPVGP